MSARVAVGYINDVCELGLAAGMSRAQLLQVACLDAAELDAPDATVPAAALFDLLRCVRAHTGDAALGLRLAGVFDLRKQGFWGYALLSSMSMRERVEVHRRYQTMRAPAEFSVREDGDKYFIDVHPRGIPNDLVPVLLDWAFAGACKQHRRRIQRSASGLALWLSYPEQPHHAELRAIVGGPIVFDAGRNSLQLPAADLDMKLAGDPELSKLATRQLEAKLPRGQPALAGRALLDEVRGRMLARLAGDASLERVSRDLRMSTRTLRRQLVAAGSSYHALLEDTRRERAQRELVEGQLPIEEIARMLGYGDVANFRRAFRRWTGVAPSAFRSRQCGQTASAARPKPAKARTHRVA